MDNLYFVNPIMEWMLRDMQKMLAVAEWNFVCWITFFIKLKYKTIGFAMPTQASKSAKYSPTSS